MALINSKGRMLAHATNELVARSVKGKWHNDPHKIADILRQWQAQVVIDCVVIEHAFARSGQGIVSTAKYVASADMVEGVAAGLMLSTTRVSPAKWKAGLGLKGGPKNKHASRQLAKDLWERRAHWFDKAASHNVAEAALIGYYWHKRG